MKKTFFISMIAAMLCIAGVKEAHANDGVFFVNGNQLVPLQETDIAVAKEVLTISLCDDGYASVDVQYEFYNRGKAKTVKMGFEAQAPYNDDLESFKQGAHPYIDNFTVTMNGMPLTFQNGMVASGGANSSTFKKLDMNQWRPTKQNEEWAASNHLYNPQMDSVTVFAYAYYFTADFKAGKNTVHHTYRYKTSSGVGRTYEIPYWLTPAMRWANHQIDDFTLRIKAEHTAKHFCLDAGMFKQASFQLVSGVGKIRKSKLGWNDNLIEISLRNGTVEWHAKNFRPESDMCITSADAYMSFDEKYPVGSFYDRSDNYIPSWNFDNKPDPVILRNLPYASRGYVFKKKQLKDYFSKMWWYMPDPQWKQSTDDFTPREWRLINQGE